MGLNKAGNREKLLKHYEKVVVCYQLRKTLKTTATDLNTKATKTQRRLKWVLKNAEFLSDGCCCLKDVGSKILCRISWLWVNQLCHVNFLARPSTVSTLKKCKQPPQPVWVSALPHIACGTPGQSFVSKDESRTTQVRALQSNRHQQEPFTWTELADVPLA